MHFESFLQSALKSLGILSCALGVGFISFLAGFIGPLIFMPESNLGPLLGIFITGPVGFGVGLLLGTLIFGLTDKTSDLRTEMRWLCLLWVLSLLGYRFLNFFGGYALLSVVGLQTAIIIVGSVFVVAGKKRHAVPPVTNIRRAILVVAAVAMALMSVFPPVEVTAAVQGSEPLFIFMLDSRLDASMHVPDYTIDPGLLLARWAVIAAIALAACLLIGLRRRGPWG